MIHLDIEQLNEKFWATPLTYIDEEGETVTMADSQILVENQPDDDIDESKPWVRWTINPGESKLIQTGPKLYKNLGIATLQVFVPKGQGTGAATDIREAFNTAFREWRSPDQKLKVYKLSNTKGSGDDYLQVNANLFYESHREG